MSSTKQHPFARAGYVGPYTLAGAVESWHDPLEGSMFNDGSARKACGSCDVCGTCFGRGAQFIDANGLKFKTGLTCAEKAVRAAGDLNMASTLQDMGADSVRIFNASKRKAHGDERRAAYDARRAEEKAQAITTYTAIDWEALEEIAHPLDWRANLGDSWACAARWYMDQGNVSSALRTAEEGLCAILAGDAKPRKPSLPSVADSEHVGTIKKRATFTATLIGAFHFETFYGEQSIYKFADENGNALAWKTSGCLGVYDEFGAYDPIEVGAKVTFKATPKEHAADKFNDEKPVTWIARLKLA